MPTTSEAAKSDFRFVWNKLVGTQGTNLYFYNPYKVDAWFQEDLFFRVMNGQSPGIKGVQVEYVDNLEVEGCPLNSASK